MKVPVALLLSALALSASVSAQAPPGTQRTGSAATEAQAEPDEIARVLVGAPLRLREGAAVIRWNADHTYVTLKPGSNQLVCYDRSTEARRGIFAVQCTTPGNLPRVAQNRRFRAESRNAEEERALVSAAEADGTRVEPEYGAPWISTTGADHLSPQTHLTIAVPGATAASIGLPDEPGQGGAWIMDAGTSGAHLMLPGQ